MGRPKAAGPETDVTDMVRSMKRLLDVDSRQLTLFTSMRNVERDGRAALQSSIDYLVNLSGRAKDLRRQGHTVTSIVDDLFGGEIIFDGITDGQYSSANLVRLLLEADL